ncbi:bifunctional riboflavin kinase/FAD synthetase [Euhalothece natronophila Z-M001]|uniref:Riboflavin biosynthesis protein n=1 Tax=Euhalothece natronophila Z-M001 TaxID=522448 RepID=A0A5B8NJ23_9CHRO|nr:bifunctional riboflavin kinase/FAD synthetase [Euhalothece natronophila]QDZ39263.1 bifunctional riboflavin kinase/FAD synthetase [Euhalothece natronophila Z-M001]
MWITSDLERALTPTAIALGNFDGVHRGHQNVIIPVLQQPVRSTVVTFEPHPREYFSGKRCSLLTPLEEKISYLKALGVEQLILLPFNQELASLSPETFVKEILIAKLNPHYISVGEDFRFGYQRKGTAQDLSAIALTKSIEVNIISLKSNQQQRISSSRIRACLNSGEISLANELLGRPYNLTGTVTTGEQRGRTIGFPTANLTPPHNKLIPRYGVYAVEVTSSTFPITDPHPAVMNIGMRPTVNGKHPTIEVHLLNWSGNLYSHSLSIAMKQFLRPEEKFSSLDELKAQINRDCEQAISRK